jgi:hypothetical protein
MESVSFYRFAAAIMQLLEPEKYNYNQQQSVAEAIPLEIIANNSDGTLKTEEQTVAAVAEHLTQVIQQASEEKIVEVAKALEESNLIKTNLTEGGESLSSYVAEALVENAVVAAAAETIKEIKTEESTAPFAPQIVTPEEEKSFWELYPELQESEILYADTMRYLYGYADRNSLFDFLNPNIELSERQAAWSEFTGAARIENSVTSYMYNNTQKSSFSSVTQTTQSNDEQRTSDARKQADARLRMLAEQREVDERTAENRKQGIKS